MTATDPIGVQQGAVYTITGPDGTVAVLNDPTSPNFAGFLTGDDAVTGLERAGVREAADLLPDADGGVHGAFRYDRMAFSLKGQIPAEPRRENPADYFQAISESARNLVTNPRAGAGSIAGWAQPGLTTFQAVTLDGIDHPAPSAEMTALGITTAFLCETTDAAGTDAARIPIPMVAGLKYGFSVFVYGVGTTAVRALVARPGNVVLGAFRDLSTANAWTNLANVPTASPTDGSGSVEVRDNAGSGTVRWYFTGTMVQQTAGAAVDPFFDGATAPNDPTNRTAWDGQPHASQSIRGPLVGTFAEERLVWARRIDRLLGATNAMGADAYLSWIAASGRAVRLAFRQQQPTRITGRRPKAFIVAGVSENSAVEDATSTIVDTGVLPLMSARSAGAPPFTAYTGTINVAGSILSWPVVTLIGKFVGWVYVSIGEFQPNPIAVNAATAAADTPLPNDGALRIDTSPRQRTAMRYPVWFGTPENSGGTGPFNAYERLLSVHRWVPLRPGAQTLRVSIQPTEANANQEGTGSKSRVLVEFRNQWG